MPWSFRGHFVLVGSLIWGYYALAQDMSVLRPLFNRMAALGRRCAGDWDAPSHELPPPLAFRLGFALADLEWLPIRGRHGRSFVETDATPLQWAHVFTDCLRRPVSTCAGPFLSPLVIHIAELVAANTAVLHQAHTAPGHTLVLATDSEIAKAVIHKGHSPVPVLNAWAHWLHSLCLAADLRIVVTHVDTHRNLADAPSRAPLPPSLPPCLHATCAAPPFGGLSERGGGSLPSARHCMLAVSQRSLVCVTEAQRKLCKPETGRQRTCKFCGAKKFSQRQTKNIGKGPKAPMKKI